ncbi:MAG: extracellular solute-binding protein [Chloroflexi bacterium]|nr:extracellular solute-binding protein [Chloroflexota bacterium]
MRLKALTVSAFVLVVLSLVVASCAPAAPPPTAAPPTPVAGRPTPTPAVASPQEQALAQLLAAAKKEGKVTVYAFSFTGDIGIALQKGFQDKYGIPVELITGRGAEMGERIKTERRIGTVVADIMESSPANTTNLKVGGATVSSSDIPVLKEKDVWQVDPLVNDPEGHLLGHRAMNFGPYINTNLVKPGEEPKSYKDFLNPKWEGKMLTSDPNVSSGSYDLFVTLMEYNRIDLDTVRAIGKAARLAPGTRQIAEALARGEFPLGVEFSDVDAAPFLKEGAPIRALPMQEGVVSLTSAMVRVKDGPHPNAAKLFMNWMLSKEGQTVYTKAAGLASVRKDVADARHAGSHVNAPLFPIDVKIAEKEAQLFRDKYLVNLWKK